MTTANYWTFEAVEDRLIEAMRFAWRDEPGRWPFAGDGPWDQIVKEIRAGDYDARGGFNEAPPVRLPRLSRIERARMDIAMGWLRIVADDGVDRMQGGDARLIVLALRKLASHRGEGRGRVPWSRLLRPMGVKRGAGMLSKRYSRAVARIVSALHKSGEMVDYAR